MSVQLPKVPAKGYWGRPEERDGRYRAKFTCPVCKAEKGHLVRHSLGTYPNATAAAQPMREWTARMVEAANVAGMTWERMPCPVKAVEEAKAAANAPAAQSFAQYAEAWINDTDRHRASTMRGERSVWRAHAAKSPLATMKLKDVDSAAVARWYDRMKAEKVSPHMRWAAYVQVRSIMATAVEDEAMPEVTRNPASNRQYLKRPKASERQNATREEIEKVIAAIRVKANKAQNPTMSDEGATASMKLVIALSASCALRHEEAEALRVGDVRRINVKGRQMTVLSISKAAPEGVDEDGRVRPITGDTKSEAGRRVVPVPGALADRLNRYIERYRGTDTSALLLPSTVGRMWTYKTIARAFHTASVEAGVEEPPEEWPNKPKGAREWKWTGRSARDPRKRWNLHALRHTGIMWAARAPGMTSPALRTFSGHENTASIEPYLHSEQDQMMAAMDAMDRAQGTATTAAAANTPKSIEA